MRPDELLPGLGYRVFLDEARRHRTEDEFRASLFFALHGKELERLLLTPKIERAGSPAPAPSAPSASIPPEPVSRSGREARLRVVHWNIEKGRAFDSVVRRLRNDPALRGADVYTLNEVDDGTARGGNRDQAADLARELGCTAVFLPCWIECTRGVAADLAIPGEHRRGLQGLAVLARLPVQDARAVALPPCFDTFDFHEKRFGGRRGLFALLQWRGRPLVVGTTHLEVRNTPKCRAGQFRAFLGGLREALDAWSGGEPGSTPTPPVVLTGDWNTNTFRRGTFEASVREFLRIVSRTPGRLAEETAWPLAREPLFADLAAEGFQVGHSNEPVPTAAQALATVEDLRHLPLPLARRLLRLFGLEGREVRMRLDWIAARGLRPEGRPLTRPAAAAGEAPASDHAIIAAEFG